MPDPFRFYGVKEFSKSSSETDRSIEEIRIAGYSVIGGVLSDADLSLVREKLDEIYEVQTQEIGGVAQLERMNDAHVVRLLLAYDDYFLKLATNATVLAVVEGLLGDYFILMQQNGIINVPDVENYQISWHRDLSYQHFVSTRPLAISAIFCLDDFSEESGGTHVLPASHKIEAFPSQEFLEKNQRTIVARAGSVLVFDSMLYHRSGYNRSTSKRRALNHVYTLPFIKQQISIPDALQGKFRDVEFLRKFLGYESEPGKNVTQWRTSKIERTSAQSRSDESPSSGSKESGVPSLLA
jgi:ectoine hydroxylase-related dioxygenase (phytanoyl-CoA dioxygenase family)